MLSCIAPMQSLSNRKLVASTAWICKLLETSIRNELRICEHISKRGDAKIASLSLLGCHYYKMTRSTRSLRHIIGSSLVLEGIWKIMNLVSFYLRLCLSPDSSSLRIRFWVRLLTRATSRVGGWSTIPTMNVIYLEQKILPCPKGSRHILICQWSSNILPSDPSTGSFRQRLYCCSLLVAVHLIVPKLSMEKTVSNGQILSTLSDSSIKLFYWTPRLIAINATAMLKQNRVKSAPQVMTS